MMGYDYETAAPENYRLLEEYAKKNRREMTESETVLWNALRKLKIGLRFRRQHVVGNYIADFICLPARLVIEVDGGYHQDPQQQMRDQLRTEFLRNQNFRVIRIKNEEISDDLNKVVQKIKSEVLKDYST